MSSSQTIFVGNLASTATEDTMKEFFGQIGTVVSARIIKDKETRAPKGFGFVEFESPELAEEAKTKLNDAEFEGKNIRVDIAKAPTQRRGGGGGGRGGYGGRGDGGGGRGGYGGRGGGGGGRGGYGGRGGGGGGRGGYGGRGGGGGGRGGYGGRGDGGGPRY